MTNLPGKVLTEAEKATKAAREKEERHKKALDPELSPHVACHLVREFPEEILTHSALSLWGLEHPDLVLKIQDLGRQERVRRRVKPYQQWDPLLMRRVAVEAVESALPIWEGWVPPTYKTLGEDRMDVRDAVRVARAFVERKASKYELSLMLKFSQLFGWQFSWAQRNEQDTVYLRMTKALAELCEGVCKSSREELWDTVEKACLFYTHAHEQGEPFVFVSRLETYADRLRELHQAPKSKKRQP